MQKRQPIPYVDLEPYAHLSDRDTALALGSRPRYADFHAFWIERDRSGEDDYERPAGRQRCEAGRVQRLGLRCLRMALPGERWCEPHHPEPPPPPAPEAVQEIARLTRLKDSDAPAVVLSLVAEVAAVLVRAHALLDRLEQAPAAPESAATPALVWTVAQAADELGVSKAHLYRMIRENKVPFIRISDSVLRFDPAELKDWMRTRAIPPVR